MPPLSATSQLLPFVFFRPLPKGVFVCVNVDTPFRFLKPHGRLQPHLNLWRSMSLYGIGFLFFTFNLLFWEMTYGGFVVGLGYQEKWGVNDFQNRMAMVRRRFRILIFLVLLRTLLLIIKQVIIGEFFIIYYI